MIFLFKPFYHLKDFLQLREAKMLADKHHQEDGERYYVLPNGPSSGKLIVMDRKQFRRLKAKRYIPRDTKVMDLARECFYMTPGRQVAGIDKKTIRQKAKYFYLWKNECRLFAGLKKKNVKALKIRDSLVLVLLFGLHLLFAYYLLHLLRLGMPG